MAEFRAVAVAHQISQLRVDSYSRTNDATSVFAEDELADENALDEVAKAARRRVERETADYRICTALADQIMGELGICIPSTYSYVVAVLGEVPGVTKTSTRLGFALYDNYHPESRPSAEEIEKIKAAFGFKGEPAWFMDAIETFWVSDE